MAMFLSNFSESAVIILIGLGVVTFLWELTEYLVTAIPSWTRYTKNKFRLSGTDFEWGDTVFDIVLNFLGATLFFYVIK